MFARDADTGMAKWVYQMTPHDEWDYDGVNENVLVDLEVDGRMRKALVHFDRNGFGYTLDRENGELLVAEKFDPAVNWATHVDMRTGRPQVVDRYSTGKNGEDFNTEDICPAALGTKDQQPAAYSPRTKLFYVPTNHVCMDYEPYEVEYVAGQPYVGAVLTMFPAGQATRDGTTNLGNFIAWDAAEGKIVWSLPEPFSVWSGALATAGDVVFYGTLEGLFESRRCERRGKSSTASRRRPESSATSTPGRTRASSTSECCPASAAGPESAWRPGSRARRTVSAPSARIARWPGTRSSAAC